MTSATARGAGVVRGHVEHVDRTAVRSLEDASPRLQPRNDRNRAPLNAHRLIADGDAEKVAEGQHAGALRDLHRLLEIEIRKLGRADFQHGDFEPRVGAHQLRLEAAAIGQHGSDVVGVEHVAIGRKDVAGRRDEHSALIGFHAAESARPVDFDDLRLNLSDSVGYRRGSGGGDENEKERQKEKPQAARRDPSAM